MWRPEFRPLRRCCPPPRVRPLTHFLECFEALFAVLGLGPANSLTLVEHYDAFVEGTQRWIDLLTADGAAVIAETAMCRKVFDVKTGITVSTIHGVIGRRGWHLPLRQSASLCRDVCNVMGRNLERCVSFDRKQTERTSNHEYDVRLF